MIKQLIPGDNHVVRHVGRDKMLSDGRISGQAFRRKDEEEYMSVNWVEYFGLISHIAAIQKIEQAYLNKGRTVNKSSKFAVINIDRMTECVNKEAHITLHVKHEGTSPDPSHSGVFNMPKEDTTIGNLIAQIIDKDAIYPAQGKRG